MKLEVTVSEIADIFKEIQERPGQLFEMIRLDIKEVVGNYLTAMMNAELTHYLGREPYVRVVGNANHRNGSYGRGFALKGVGEVRVDVPRDRNGEFKTSVIPRSKQYEEEIARDFSILFLAGVSTRTLSMISERLIGRRISPTEISSASSDLNGAVEAWRRRDLSQEPVKYLFIDGVHFHMKSFPRRRSSAARSMWPEMFWPRCRRSSSRMWRMIYVPSFMLRHRKSRGNVLKASGRDGKRAYPLRWNVWSEASMPV